MNFRKRNTRFAYGPRSLGAISVVFILLCVSLIGVAGLHPQPARPIADIRLDELRQTILVRQDGSLAVKQKVYLHYDISLYGEPVALTLPPFGPEGAGRIVNARAGWHDRGVLVPAGLESPRLFATSALIFNLPDSSAAKGGGAGDAAYDIGFDAERAVSTDEKRGVRSLLWSVIDRFGAPVRRVAAEIEFTYPVASDAVRMRSGIVSGGLSRESVVREIYHGSALTRWESGRFAAWAVITENSRPLREDEEFVVQLEWPAGGPR